MAAAIGHEDRYTVRYRGRGRRGQTTLLVEDEQGRAYLFSGGWLQGRLSGERAVDRLAAILAERTTWRAVPEVYPYTINGLRQLVGLPTIEQHSARQRHRSIA